MGYGHGEIDKLVGEEKPAHPISAGGFEDLVADMAAANITLSTVAIGDKPNLPLMTGLAQWGSGKSYVAQRDSEIPALFVTEARRLLGESLIEEPFRPVAKGRSEMLAGIDFESGPELKGFVAGKAKRFSDVLLQAKHEQPLLAETRYGLGKTVAFLSDAKNRWAADWLAWPGYGKFWAQVVRDAGAVRQRRIRLAGHAPWGEGLLWLTAPTADGTLQRSVAQGTSVRPNGNRPWSCCASPHLAPTALASHSRQSRRHRIGSSCSPVLVCSSRKSRASARAPFTTRRATNFARVQRTWGCSGL
jgi:hypothetical protein